MEAMGVGLPIIATNIRGHRDLIHSNYNGYLFNVNNYKELFNKIILIAGNTSISNRFLKNNLNIIKKFSTQSVDRKMRNIYSKITRD